jgi:hypothetical protein
MWEIRRGRGFRTLGAFRRVSLLVEKNKTRRGDSDKLTPVEAFRGDEPAILRVFPNCEFRTGSAPDIDHFLISPLAALEPDEEIDNQGVNDSVSHGRFPVLLI